MNLITAARRVFSWALWLRHGSTLSWAHRLARHDARPNRQSRVVSPDVIGIYPTGLQLSKDLHLDPLLESFDCLCSLAYRHTRVTKASPWDVVEVDSTKFQVFNRQAITILKEIYVDGVYEVHLPAQIVVIDIGMNVGTAALFFAASFQCPVYGFEPFNETYQRALSNIALNPQIASLIHPENSGVAGTDRTAVVRFCPESPADCGLFPIPECAVQGRATHDETITLRNATDIVDKVCAAHPDRHLIMKVDCEGSEYEIVDSLITSERIERVAAFIIEWHRRAGEDLPHSLREKLVKAGFGVFGAIRPDADIGVFSVFRADTSSRPCRQH